MEENVNGYEKCKNRSESRPNMGNIVLMEEAQPEQHRLQRYLSIISICRSQQLSLILLMADAGMIIPIGRMYLNTVKMAVFRQ